MNRQDFNREPIFGTMKKTPKKTAEPQQLMLDMNTGRFFNNDVSDSTQETLDSLF